MRGFRKLSVLLPKLILPAKEKVGRHVINTLHGFKLIIDPSIDRGVELSLFETGTYEKGILHFIEENYDPKGAFLDIGANIGLMSIFVASKFESSKVIAFEAHPKTEKILLENIILNHLGNIQVERKAVGNASKEVVIHDNWSMNRGAASIKYGDPDSSGYKVKMITIDDFITEPVSMIKIDVEGAELEVLEGMSETIKRDHPVLIVEISKGRLESKDDVAIYDLINDQGIYTIFKLKGTKERVSDLVQINSKEELPDHDNIICIPK